MMSISSADVDDTAGGSARLGSDRSDSTVGACGIRDNVRPGGARVIADSHAAVRAYKHVACTGDKGDAPGVEAVAAEQTWRGISGRRLLPVGTSISTPPYTGSIGGSAIAVSGDDHLL